MTWRAWSNLGIGAVICLVIFVGEVIYRHGWAIALGLAFIVAAQIVVR